MDLKIKHATIHIGQSVDVISTDQKFTQESVFDQEDMDRQFGLGFNAAIAEVAINWNQGGPEQIHTMLRMHPAVDADALRPFAESQASEEPHHNEQEGTSEYFGDDINRDADDSEDPFSASSDAALAFAAHISDVNGFGDAIKRALSSGELDVEAEDVPPEDSVIPGFFKVSAVEMAEIRRSEYERGRINGETEPRRISTEVFRKKVEEVQKSADNVKDLYGDDWVQEFSRMLLRSLNVVVR